MGVTVTLSWGWKILNSPGWIKMSTEARTKAGPMVTRIGINWKVKRQAKNNPIENSATCLTVL